MRIIAIDPIGKPRMTQRDRWKKRPAVERYYAFKDALKAARVEIPESVEIHFVIAMPPSWSKRKRERMNGKPHQQTPDIDNLVKGLLDAVCDNDAYVHTHLASKRWGVSGEIHIGEYKCRT